MLLSLLSHFRSPPSFPNAVVLLSLLSHFLSAPPPPSLLLYFLLPHRCLSCPAFPQHAHRYARCQGRRDRPARRQEASAADWTVLLHVQLLLLCPTAGRCWLQRYEETRHRCHCHPRSDADICEEWASTKKRGVEARTEDVAKPFTLRLHSPCSFLAWSLLLVSTDHYTLSCSLLMTSSLSHGILSLARFSPFPITSSYPTSPLQSLSLFYLVIPWHPHTLFHSLQL